MVDNAQGVVKVVFVKLLNYEIFFLAGSRSVPTVPV